MISLVILLSVISGITYGYSFARYVSKTAWNHYLSTKGFYFSSEQLDTTKVTNVNNNWNLESTYFTIKNSEDNILVTEYDINYTVKCTIQNEASSYSKCTLNGTDSDTFTGVISSSSVCKNNIDDEDTSLYTKEECETKGYEWIVQENHKELYFDVVKTTEQELKDVNVLIEVTTNKPFSKKITGEFKLSNVEIEKNGLELDYKEYDNYNRLIVTNSYDENKCVKLNWNPNNLQIDDTNQKIISSQTNIDGYINEIVFSIDKKDSISYIFYKTDFTKVYDKQEFTLIEWTEC